MGYPTKFPEARELIIKAMPGTQKELEERAGVSRMAVKWHLKCLREDGLSYIGDYRRNPTGGAHPAVHFYGKGKDKRCRFKLKDRTEYQHEWAKRRWAVEKLIKQATAVKATPFSALFFNQGKQDDTHAS